MRKEARDLKEVVAEQARLNTVRNKRVLLCHEASFANGHSSAKGLRVPKGEVAPINTLGLAVASALSVHDPCVKLMKVSPKLKLACMG